MSHVGLVLVPVSRHNYLVIVTSSSIDCDLIGIKQNQWVRHGDDVWRSSFLTLFVVLLCRVRNKMMHVLSWWTICAHSIVIWVFIVRRAGLLWSQQDFEWRWSVPLFKCITVLEFSFISFDLCLLITFFNFIMNYVPIVTFWIFTYHKIWILSIMFCFIWSYWIIYFLACLEVSWRVVS